MQFKVETTTKKILGIFYLVLAVFLAITWFGIMDTSPYVLGTTAIFMGAILLSEGHVSQFFTKSTYNRLSGKEMLNLATVITGAGIIIMGIAMLSILPVAFNVAVLHAFGVTAGILVISGGIFSFIHFWI